MGRPLTHNLAGGKFGRLTVKEYNGGGKWLCECECGNQKIIVGASIANGDTKSCGCIRKEKTAERDKDRAKHGMYKTKEYAVWRSMKERCNNPNHHAFESYGGRGINVCQRWSDSFEAFYSDMGTRPEGGSLDRIDNNDGYYPENCRWATSRQQQNNRRVNTFVCVNGSEVTVAEASRRLGIPVTTLHSRIARGTLKAIKREK